MTKKMPQRRECRNMKVLIDTNIILDVLCGREKFLEDAERIFKLCETRRLDGFISALSIPNIIYILRKELDADKVETIVNDLSIIFTIADLKAEDVKKAAGLKFKDYEDAVQSTCAERIGAEYIITRNVKDFADSNIPAISSMKFLR